MPRAPVEARALREALAARPMGVHRSKTALVNAVAKGRAKARAPTMVRNKNPKDPHVAAKELQKDDSIEAVSDCGGVHAPLPLQHEEFGLIRPG